jgi:hypothetical protein
MADRILYVVATSREKAEQQLLGLAPVQYGLTDRADADDIARTLNGKNLKVYAGTYQVFPAKVTVEMLED